MKLYLRSLKKKPVARWLKSLSKNSVVRWWIVGLAFTFANIPFLYFLIDILKLPEWFGTLLASEIVTILRFFVNDRWVFGYVFPTWKRLWQYHVANASGFLIWWVITNLLIYRFSVNYILASILATACSVGWSMVTNFLWIWKPKKEEAKPSSRQRKGQ